QQRQRIESDWERRAPDGGPWSVVAGRCRGSGGLLSRGCGDGPTAIGEYDRGAVGARVSVRADPAEPDRVGEPVPGRSGAVRDAALVRESAGDPGDAWHLRADDHRSLLRGSEPGRGSSKLVAAEDRKLSHGAVSQDWPGAESRGRRGAARV